MKEIMMSGKLTKKDVLSFMVYHNYHTFGGAITGVLGIIGLIGAPLVAWLTGDLFIVILLGALGLMYAFFTPLDFYSKAVRQLRMNPVFKNKMTFRLTDEGVYVQLYTGPMFLRWPDLYKLVVLKSMVLLYTDDDHAYVIPLRFFACQDDLELLKEHVDQLAAQVPESEEADLGQEASGLVDAVESSELENQENLKEQEQVQVALDEEEPLEGAISDDQEEAIEKDHVATES